MKNIIILLLTIFLFSCENEFLEIPDTSGTVDLDEIYSSGKNAEGALAKCYRDVLKHGWPTGWGVGHGNLGSISGERYKGYSWHGTFHIAESGLSVTGSDGSDAGADHYKQNWMYIRACYIVKENIDRVPDMSDEMKGYIKAEATALIAYRYMGMFYRYGGLPLVVKSFNSDDDLFIGRSPLSATYNFVEGLIEEAYSGLPDRWESKYGGRITKGAALAMKARLQMFAARPLFNSSKPYISGSETDSLVCFGAYDTNRWNEAIKSNEAVLTWAKANGYELRNTGGAGDGNPNPNAMDDYGTAVSLPNNNEVILAYKFNEENQNNNYLAYYYNASPYWWKDRWDTDNIGLLTNFLENYYLEDGTTPVWPKVGDASPLPASHWLENMSKIEARFKVDYIVPGAGSKSNPGDNSWNLGGWGRRAGNTSASNSFPGVGESGKGCGAPTKFYYKAGGRTWFEPPLFRLAETYLNLAEAYNEIGNTSKALESLNKVHNRAGLPKITESDQARLRTLIQREKAIEFVGENQRYYDVKHWKHPDIANGIIGGNMRELQFYSSSMNNNGQMPNQIIHYWDANSYVAYWNPRMYLEPIPQTEVNKGVTVQNPGY
ncbi:RagB/SusD family nutrient uptake outer membrane protein [Dysgonomonas sp. Marseille-P4677]|uniref:RagB/SusD family nutrient uptake outer membrane protein n=1 Tax=Dysgonomonas sp. Marseille-P4677 TaxID=2364790 RepID=UPI00191344D8|nr:RagB/SusD family nutrient uptake outer membrane protein [Dysgonomonas sp. Marseille-P4677]MBK5720639.1 RagB/SusD family nutrient uptake outer membrane protein [Dysgonomonas sp. Marseille-P4677]